MNSVKQVLGALFIMVSFSTWAQYSGGNGSDASPYIIATAQDLVALCNTPEDWSGKTFHLSANINMEGKTFTPIGNTQNVFKGNFDGRKFSISNLTITPKLNDGVASQGTGLFGAFSGNLTNLGLMDVQVDVSMFGNSSRVGALVGELKDGTVSKCYAEGGSVNVGNGGWSGGLVGLLWEGGNKTVEDCYCSAWVKAGWRCGGVVGCTRGAHKINRVAFYGTINGKNAVVEVHAEKGGIPPTNAVYSSTTNGTDANATMLDNVKLLDASNYPTFDFDKTWEISTDKGYATLQDEVVEPEIDFFEKLRTQKVPSDTTIVWKNFGPGMSGYNEEFWCHPTDTNVMFMGPDMLVAYGTWDNGLSWQTIRDCDGDGSDMERVNDLTFSAVHPDFGLAIERRGKLYWTHNRGRDWELIYQFPHGAPGKWYNAHSRIVIHPSNDSVWYVGTGGFWDVKANHRSQAQPHGQLLSNYAYGYILKTTDMGKSWKKIANTISDSLDVGRICINPRHPDSVLIATGHGMFLSADAGETWTPSSAGLPNNLPKDLAAYYQPSTQEYVLYTMEQSVYSIKNNTVETSGGVYKSTDGGLSWVSITGNLGLDFTQITDWLYRNSFAKTVGYWLGKNADEIWKLNFPKHTLQVYRRIVVNPLNKNEIYLYGNQRHDKNFGPGEIWKTEDGGDTWKIVARHSSYWRSGANAAYWKSKGMETAPNVSFSHVRDALAETHPVFIGTRTLAMNSIGQVFTGIGQQTHRSNDGGNAWLQIDDDETSLGSNIWVGRGASNLPGEALLLKTGIPDRKLLCSGEHGLWQTDDLGEFPNQDAVAVRQIEGQVHDVNGTQSLHTASAVAVHPHNPDIIYVMGFRQTHRGKLRRSLDGGKTWKNIATLFDSPNSESSSTAFPRSLIIDPIHPDNMYFTAVFNRLNATTDGPELSIGEYGVYRSDDGGFHWKVSNADFPSRASVQNIVMHPDNPSVFYAALSCRKNGDPFGLYKSVNKTLNWTKMNIPSKIRSVNNVFIDPNTKYLYLSTGTRGEAYDGGGVYRSKDEGKSWELIFKAPFVWHVKTSPHHPHMILVNSAGQATDGIQNPGLFLSKDDGKTWIRINKGLGNINKMTDIGFDPYNENILWASAWGSGWYKAMLPYEGVKSVCPNAEVVENETLTLYGIASLGTQLRYKWIAPRNLEISDSTGHKTTFRAPEVKADSTLSFQLVVFNASYSDTSMVEVQVRNKNQTALADARVPNVKVYPVPVSDGALYVDGVEPSSRYAILNLNGALLKNGKINSNHINVTSLRSGLYFIRFEVNQKYVIKKLIVQ